MIFLLSGTGVSKNISFGISVDSTACMTTTHKS